MSIGLVEFLILVVVGLLLLTVVVVARTAEKQRRERALRDARRYLDGEGPS
ncbi:hypothetical protein [Actinokineospora inagensis]|uniref:hypothetical protein n=1 Tax=Actinokineospora inagensis TaxID=103730 RepID=UPI0004186409|nr:hypothetical protein [Actinokineospora inagensis]